MGGRGGRDSGAFLCLGIGFLGGLGGGDLEMLGVFVFKGVDKACLNPTRKGMMYRGDPKPSLEEVTAAFARGVHGVCKLARYGS